MLNCKKATLLLSESLERPLSLKERIPLGMHVAMCSGCGNFGRQLHALRRIARAYAKDEK